MKSRHRGASLVMLAPLFLLILHACFYTSYGIFRDEYYYFACGLRPAWGYVDHPPLIGWISFALSYLMHKDLSLYRFWSFAASAAYLALLLHWVRQHRGGPLALTLVAVAVIFSPIRLGIAHFFSMNSLEPLIWLAMFWLFSKLNTLTLPGLLGLGLLIGIGTLNKHTTAIYAALLSIGFYWDAPQRRRYSRDVLLVALMAVLVISPHLLWQWEQGWPTLEFQNNARLYKNAALSIPGLLGELILHHHPLVALLWIPGLWILLRKQRWRFLRGYALTVLMFLPMLLITRGKAYYAAGLIGPLIAVAAVEFESYVRRAGWILPALIAITGLLLLPLTLPVLPVATYQAFERLSGFRPSAGEMHEQGALPQHYADMFGWKELAEQVAEVFQKLPAADQAATAIYAQNYGQAGAIDYYGPALGLPSASSGHNTYYLWGYHPENFTQILIIGGKREDHLEVCGTLEVLAEFDHPLRMPYERHLPLYLCRELKLPPAEIWPRTKEFI